MAKYKEGDIIATIYNGVLWKVLAVHKKEQLYDLANVSTGEEQLYDVATA